jgi:hypothetical protein
VASLPGAKNARLFALGPPRDADEIADLDPRGEGSFPDNNFAASVSQYFAAAVTTTEPRGPFANRYCIPQSTARTDPVYCD